MSRTLVLSIGNHALFALLLAITIIILNIFGDQILSTVLKYMISVTILKLNIFKINIVFTAFMPNIHINWHMYRLNFIIGVTFENKGYKCHILPN